MIKNQDETNWGDPKQHFAWALRFMPLAAGSGAVTHPAILEKWSEHLYACGFAHRDYLASLADEDGNIHVSKLPAQAIKLQPAIRGPRHQYNTASQWVASDKPDPPKFQLPDIMHLTAQENAAMIAQYRRAGMIEDAIVGPTLAGEIQ